MTTVLNSERVVCWFSCGAASACATSLAIDKGPSNVVAAYCASVLSAEHQDNIRFLADCKRWFGLPIEMLCSDRYRDPVDVWTRTGWLVGPKGARCSTELKKKVRQRFENLATDLQVFGFTADEEKRAEEFRAHNPEIRAWFPLIDAGITKAECYEMIDAAGIKRPAMYDLGYRNNNCIGCVKGGQGYWNMIRRDFPSVFDSMAKLERTLDVAILKDRRGGVRCRLFLDELEPGAGRYKSEPDISCGVTCQIGLPSETENRTKEES
jgi:hypothetical protein